jgi:predicted alpha/beta superfamily hydrolase
MFVALPNGYHESGARYPVLYVLDGEFFFYQAHAAVQFLAECTYIRTPPIPQLIVVGIVNVDRNRDFTPTHAPVQGELRYPTSGGAAKFLTFFQSELAPLIDAKYRTQPYQILSGWSFGGLFTVHTYLNNPEAFSAYLAISPSLWWERDSLVEKAKTVLADGQASGKPFVVTLGALEGGDMDRSVRQGLFPSFKADRSSTTDFTPIELADREHYYSPYEAFFDGLFGLFADWELPEDRLRGGLKSVQGFYKELSAKVGYEVEIPAPAYQALVWSLVRQGDEVAAFEIARTAAKKFPQSSRAHMTLGILLKRTGDVAAARARFNHAIEVEKQLSEPDSERITDVWLQLWLLDQEAEAAASTSN